MRCNAVYGNPGEQALYCAAHTFVLMQLGGCDRLLPRCFCFSPTGPVKEIKDDSSVCAFHGAFVCVSILLPSARAAAAEVGFYPPFQLPCVLCACVSRAAWSTGTLPGTTMVK